MSHQQALLAAAEEVYGSVDGSRAPREEGIVGGGGAEGTDFRKVIVMTESGPARPGPEGFDIVVAEDAVVAAHFLVDVFPDLQLRQEAVWGEQQQQQQEEEEEEGPRTGQAGKVGGDEEGTCTGRQEACVHVQGRDGAMNVLFLQHGRQTSPSTNILRMNHQQQQEAVERAVERGATIEGGVHTKNEEEEQEGITQGGMTKMRCPGGFVLLLVVAPLWSDPRLVKALGWTLCREAREAAEAKQEDALASTAPSQGSRSISYPPPVPSGEVGTEAEKEEDDDDEEEEDEEEEKEEAEEEATREAVGPQFPALAMEMLTHSPEPFPTCPNSRESIPIKSDYFEGEALFMVKSDPVDPKYSQIFEGKNRLFEIQVQGRFLSRPAGDLYIGVEITEPMRLGLIARGACKVLLGFAQRLNKYLHYSFGDAKAGELAHISFPLLTSVDNLIVTEEGQEVPKLGTRITEDPEDKRKRVKARGFDVGELKLGATYTYCFHSMYLNIPRWSTSRIAGLKDLDLHAFWGDCPMRITAYATPPGTGLKEAHVEKDLSYIMRLQFRHDPECEESVTWESSPSEEVSVGGKRQAGSESAGSHRAVSTSAAKKARGEDRSRSASSAFHLIDNEEEGGDEDEEEDEEDEEEGSSREGDTDRDGDGGGEVAEDSDGEGSYFSAMDDEEAVAAQGGGSGRVSPVPSAGRGGGGAKGSTGTDGEMDEQQYQEQQRQLLIQQQHPRMARVPAYLDLYPTAASSSRRHKVARSLADKALRSSKHKGLQGNGRRVFVLVRGSAIVFKPRKELLSSLPMHMLTHRSSRGGRSGDSGQGQQQGLESRLSVDELHRRRFARVLHLLSLPSCTAEAEAAAAAAGGGGGGGGEAVGEEKDRQPSCASGSSNSSNSSGSRVTHGSRDRFEAMLREVMRDRSAQYMERRAVQRTLSFRAASVVKNSITRPLALVGHSLGMQPHHRSKSDQNLDNLIRASSSSNGNSGNSLKRGLSSKDLKDSGSQSFGGGPSPAARAGGGGGGGVSFGASADRDMLARGRVGACAEVVKEDFVIRVLSEHHLSEEMCVLTSRHNGQGQEQGYLELFRMKKQCLRIEGSDVIEVVMGASAGGLLPNYFSIEVQTLCLVHHLIVAGKDAAREWTDAIACTLLPQQQQRARLQQRQQSEQSEQSSESWATALGGVEQPPREEDGAEGEEVDRRESVSSSGQSVEDASNRIRQSLALTSTTSSAGSAKLYDNFLRQKSDWKSKSRWVLNCRRIDLSQGIGACQQQQQQPSVEPGLSPVLLVQRLLAQGLEVEQTSSAAAAAADSSVEGRQGAGGAASAAVAVASERLVAFLDATTQLRGVSLCGLSHEERLALFLNLFHLMIVHAFLLLGPPCSPLRWVSYFTTLSYEFAGDAVSIAELEHCILRAPMTAPRQFFSRFVIPSSEYGRFALQRPESRINFALNCGSVSGLPIIIIYEANKVHAQLDLMARYFLEQMLQVNVEKRSVALPRVLNWYANDFTASALSAEAAAAAAGAGAGGRGGSSSSSSAPSASSSLSLDLLHAVSACLLRGPSPSVKSRQLARLLASAETVSINVRFLPFEWRCRTPTHSSEAALLAASSGGMG